MIGQALIRTPAGEELLLHAFRFQLSTESRDHAGDDGFMVSEAIAEHLEAELRPVGPIARAALLRLNPSDLRSSSINLLGKDWIIRNAWVPSDDLWGQPGGFQVTCWRPLQ
jgi:hypothetical protein